MRTHLMRKKHIYFLVQLGALFVLLFIIMVSAAAFVPQRFPVGTTVHIPKNSGISKIADLLAEKHVIASPFLFKITAVLLHDRNIAAGDYFFDKQENLWTVTRRLANGEQGLTPIKATIPEGSTIQDIAWILLKRIPNFDAPYFIKIAAPYEGYLFPDTYQFYINSTPEEIIKTMQDNFTKKFQNITLDVALARRKPADIVTMASILEREARTLNDRATIAGILWKRLDEGMPLQVDATLVYITGDGSVSLDDTKLDSPYNTYKNKGLPLTAISNPGLDSLRAAAQPIKTPYYYYLSDSKGVIHYATTFEGHQINREKYLRK
jgi:UPF0755 protein